MVPNVELMCAHAWNLLLNIGKYQWRKEIVFSA